ncbi:hypothetical protein LA5095_01436 [Roseibium album]|uniref:Uncharacterized protein n=1 Tax=Roseibium album TaxID=311410 RepID=A0A0M6Z5K5_9HYPH|nr:hypothetical protein LA5094_00454 [Roseibium album]CTQ68626.1 hypothetical protein LA5095_01436 [Roseibium album]CTQ70857.1 hypothetical protein LA5096_02691 [Roseibium album]
MSAQLTKRRRLCFSKLTRNAERIGKAVRITAAGFPIAYCLFGQSAVPDPSKTINNKVAIDLMTMLLDQSGTKFLL